MPLPFVTLVQPRDIPKLKREQLAKDRVDEIEQLIRDRPRIVKRDLSINSSFWISKFVPVGELGTGKQVEVSDPIRKLVEIGPDALPFLLASLDDDAYGRDSGRRESWGN